VTLGRWVVEACLAAEVARGNPVDRPRNKFTSLPDMLAIAATTSTPPLRRRLADRLRQLG
jgi:ferredoxin--NADP+ reductase